MKNSKEDSSDSIRRLPRIVIEVSSEQKALIQAMYGPKKQVSSNIRQVILDPTARKNTREFRQFLRAYKRLYLLLSRHLKSVNLKSPQDLCSTLHVLIECRKLLEEFRRHEP